MNLQTRWAGLTRRLLDSVSDALEPVAVDHVNWFIAVVERHWFDLPALRSLNGRDWADWCRNALTQVPVHAELTHISIFASAHVQTFVEIAMEDFSMVSGRGRQRRITRAVA